MQRSIVIYFCLNGKTKCILPNILQRVKIKHLREGEILSDFFFLQIIFWGIRSILESTQLCCCMWCLSWKQNRQLKESLITHFSTLSWVAKPLATTPPATNGKPIFVWDAGGLNCMIIITQNREAHGRHFPDSHQAHLFWSAQKR